MWLKQRRPMVYTRTSLNQGVFLATNYMSRRDSSASLLLYYNKRLSQLHWAQQLLAYAYPGLAARRPVKCSHGLCTEDKRRQVDLKSCLRHPS
jgi:hypothetical protein